MLLDDKNKIKWDKLEELVSISSTANSALTSNDFAALKRGQEQSDLVKRFNKNAADRSSGKTSASSLAISDGERTQGGNDASSDVSFDMIVLVMDYLLSEQGSFLLAPLIADIAGGCRLPSFLPPFPFVSSPTSFTDHLYLPCCSIIPFFPSPLSIIYAPISHLFPCFLRIFPRYPRSSLPLSDTIDALGLTAQTVTSLATNGLIPKPGERPDRERVQLFFRLLSSIFMSNDKGNELIGDGEDHASTNNKQTTMMHRQRAGVLNDLFSFASTALSLPMQQLQPDRMAKIQSLVGKSQVMTSTALSSSIYN